MARHFAKDMQLWLSMVQRPRPGFWKSHVSATWGWGGFLNLSLRAGLRSTSIHKQRAARLQPGATPTSSPTGKLGQGTHSTMGLCSLPKGGALADMHSVLLEGESLHADWV